ncbi:transposase family protein [Chromobacterium amazonense]|nr:transposase family protein [Chromobacterium amazonense]
MLTFAILSSIPDHRRGQGRLFDLPHVLLCSILAVLAGADSYRSVLD